MQEAWSLLNELPGASKRASKARLEIPSTLTAIAACESFQSTGLVCARAMLDMTHPEQASFLFDDFVTGSGTVAVFNVARFLDRCERLLKDATRKASRKADHEALALIAMTGTTKERLREFLKEMVGLKRARVRASVPPAAVRARAQPTTRTSRSAAHRSGLVV